MTAAVAEAPAQLAGLDANRDWMSAEVSCPHQMATGSSRVTAAVPLPRLPPTNPPTSQTPTSQDVELVDKLLAEGQAHLFAHWPPPGERDEDKRRLLAQLRHLDASYAGGLPKYIQNARKLLRDSKEGAAQWGLLSATGGRLMDRHRRCTGRLIFTCATAWLMHRRGATLPGPGANPRAGVNPFEGCVPSVPEGEKLDWGSPRFRELERAGVAAARGCAFVLVAGGLGERLGYSGIKVGESWLLG